MSGLVIVVILYHSREINRNLNLLISRIADAKSYSVFSSFEVISEAVIVFDGFKRANAFLSKCFRSGGEHADRCLFKAVEIYWIDFVVNSIV